MTYRRQVVLHASLFDSLTIFYDLSLSCELHIGASFQNLCSASNLISSLQHVTTSLLQHPPHFTLTASTQRTISTVDQSLYSFTLFRINHNLKPSHSATSPSLKMYSILTPTQLHNTDCLTLPLLQELGIRLPSTNPLSQLQKNVFSEGTSASYSDHGNKTITSSQLSLTFHTSPYHINAPSKIKANHFTLNSLHNHNLTQPDTF